LTWIIGAAAAVPHSGRTVSSESGAVDLAQAVRAVSPCERKPDCPAAAGRPAERPNCRECPVGGFAFYGEALKRRHFDPDDVRRAVLTLAARSEIGLVHRDRPRLHVLREGWAFEYRISAGGRRQILGFCLPGDLISPDLLGTRPIRHRVQALTPVVLCDLDMEAIERSLDRNRTLRRGLIGHLADSCGSMRDQVAGVGAGFAGARVARLLLDLYDRLDRRGMVGGTSFDFPLAQIHVADALGLTKVHVSRVLTAFRSEALLDYEQGRMRVLDMRALRSAAGLPQD